MPLKGFLALGGGFLAVKWLDTADQMSHTQHTLSQGSDIRVHYTSQPDQKASFNV